MSLETPMFSVIIPLYNKEKTIKRAIDSVLAQSTSNFELLVINDGSTDSGLSVVNEYTDARIRIYSQKNSGVSAARNYGILEARGDYISFLDADDEWLPTYLEIMLELIQKYPTAGAYTTSNIYIIDNKGNYIERIAKGFDGEIDGPYVSFFKLYTANAMGILSGVTICSSTATVSAKIFKEIGLFNTTVHALEDHDIWCRIALYHDIVTSKKIGVKIHSEDSELGTRINRFPIIKLPFRDYLSTLDDSYIDNHPCKDDILEYLDATQFIFARIWMLRGNNKEARKCLREISILSPEYRNRYRMHYIAACLPPMVIGVLRTVYRWMMM